MRLEYSLLSIFLTGTLAGSAISPMLPSIAMHFIGGEGLSTLILTLPSLVAVPFILFSGSLLKFFSKKSMIFFGLFIYCVSAILCFISFSEIYLIIARSLIGVGAGLVIPYATSLIADYYKDEKKIAVFGKSGIALNIGGIITLLLTGVLTSLYWRLGFLVPLISLIPMYFLYKNIIPAKKNHVHKYPFIFNLIFKKEIFFVALIYFLVMLFVFEYFSTISFVIKQNNLGDSIASGLAQSFFMVAGIISNSLMSLVKKISSNLLHAFQMLFIAQGFFSLGSLDLNLIGVFSASFLIGIGFGSFGNSMIALATDYATKINRVNTISLLVASMYLAQFVSPIFFSYISDLFNIIRYSKIYLMEGTLFLVVALFLFVSFVRQHIKIEIKWR